jgi:hypothetical protein
MTVAPDIAVPSDEDRPAGYRWLPDAAREDGRETLLARLAAGDTVAIIRTAFADRHTLPAAFWHDPDSAAGAAEARATGWLRIPRPKGWCKWIEGYVWIPAADGE